jgi:hypothetical protein
MPFKGTVGDLTIEIILVLCSFFRFTLPFNHESPIGYRYLQILGIDPRKLTPEYQVVVLGEVLYPRHPRITTPLYRSNIPAKESIENPVHIELHFTKLLKRINFPHQPERIQPHQAFHITPSFLAYWQISLEAEFFCPRLQAIKI